MANITTPQNPGFPEVYEIQVDDDVLGGPDGTANLQARQLAERTAHLREAIINLLIDIDDVVKLSGNQYIEGVKTFSSIPVLPSSNPTGNDHAVRKLYVDMQLALKADDQQVVKLAGGQTMRGGMTFEGNITLPNSSPGINHAVRRGYMDDLLVSNLNLKVDKTSMDWKTAWTGKIAATGAFNLGNSIPSGCSEIMVLVRSGNGFVHGFFNRSRITPSGITTTADTTGSNVVVVANDGTSSSYAIEIRFNSWSQINVVGIWNTVLTGIYYR